MRRVNRVSAARLSLRRYPRARYRRRDGITPITYQTPPVAPESFGALLHRYRFAACLSQDELAERAGVSQRGISESGAGSPPPAVSKYGAPARGRSRAE